MGLQFHYQHDHTIILTVYPVRLTDEPLCVDSVDVYRRNLSKKIRIDTVQACIMRLSRHGYNLCFVFNASTETRFP